MDLDRWRESGRVSTGDQNLDLQVDALRQAGCERIFEETVSGAKAERKQLLRLLDQVRSGDVVVIWKLLSATAATARPPA